MSSTVQGLSAADSAGRHQHSVLHQLPKTTNTPSLLGRWERTMREAQDEHSTIGPATPAGHSRRDFIVSAATAAAAVAVGNGTSLLEAQAAPHPNGSTSGTRAAGPYRTEGMAAYGPAGPHRRMTFERRALGPKDVAIEIKYSGVCHSDIHVIRGDWGPVRYPQITGHEIAGTVVAVGSSVSKFAIGGRVGVGTMVNSCRTC